MDAWTGLEVRLVRRMDDQPLWVCERLAASVLGELVVSEERLRAAAFLGADG